MAETAPPAPGSPPRLHHASLASAAADWITARIIDGSIRPGERVTEVALADRMGISRSPVREALRSLSREGFIELEPRRGARVGELDRRSADELYACRLLLEPPCTRAAVEVVTDERVAALEASLARMAAAVGSADAAGYVAALKDYNWTLLEGCPNRTLFGFAETSWRASLRYWDLLVRGSADYPAESLARNAAVQDAVRARDAARAGAVAAEVVERGRRQLLAVLDQLLVGGA